MNFDSLTQPQLAVVVVDRCGGSSRFVPWEEVAVAIWRAFPEKASLRSGHLPDTYSIQTWVWDAKTKLGYLQGGNREGGWRVTPAGAAWLDTVSDLRQEIRSTLLDSTEYEGIEHQHLILTCIPTGRGASRSTVVVEGFRRYPEAFGIVPDHGWPDAERVQEAIDRAIRDKSLVLVDDVYQVTATGAEHRDGVAAQLGIRLDETRGRRRAIAEQYVRRIELSDAYRAYLDTGDDDRGTDIEFFRLVRCPPNAPMNLLDASLAELLDNLARADRPELRDFVNRWAQRVLPKVATRGGLFR